MNNLPKKIIELDNCNRIWAIGSIHGNFSSIVNIHKYIFEQFHPKDKIVYLGNVIGVGLDSSKVIDEIIKFRFNLMAKFNIDHETIIYLRGAQEEMWSKLLELQISPNPIEVVNWMFSHGVNKTLKSYKISDEEVLDICRLGTILISKWTTKIKNQIESYNGHKDYYTNLSHAAFSNTKKILFVNRGVDISRPLSAQNDCFWWGYQGFSKIIDPYNNFIRIVRGYDPKKIGPKKNSIVCSLYKGSGFGEFVVAGLFSVDGEILDIFEG